MTTIVQLEEMVAAHVPPVPGKLPPLKVSGAARVVSLTPRTGAPEC